MSYVFNPFTGTFDNRGSGGVSIGDTIGGSPANNGLLFADSSDELQNDLISIQQDSFFAGAVTAKSFDVQTYANFPTLGWVDATGFGQPGAVGVLTPGVAAQNYLMIDTNTLSAKAALSYDPSTPANSYFTVALANGLAGTPELNVSTTSINVYQPIKTRSGEIYTIGDVDGNGSIYFDGNAANIYGYSYINLRDGTGQYANLTRGGAFWEATAIDTGPFGGGNYDAKMVFSGGTVTTYDAKAFGNYFGGRVAAAANNDKLYGVVFRPQFTPGAYTGLTKIGMIAVTPDASSIGMVIKGTSSQSVDLFQIRNSSDTVLSSFGSGGNLGIGGAATSTSKLNIQSIPTSSAGLATGDVWSDSGTLKIV